MSFVPYVVEQSAHGERSYDIFSRLLNDRIIFLGEEVNATTPPNCMVRWLIFSTFSLIFRPPSPCVRAEDREALARP